MRNAHNETLSLGNLIMLYGALSSVCLGLFIMTLALKTLHENNHGKRFSRNYGQGDLSPWGKNMVLSAAIAGGLVMFNGYNTLKAGECSGIISGATNIISAGVGLAVLRDYI